MSGRGVTSSLFLVAPLERRAQATDTPAPMRVMTAAMIIVAR